MKKSIQNTILIALVSVSSCQFLEKTTTEKTIARVGEVYLYETDFKKAFPKGISKIDSISFANKYIQNWATQQILKKHATVNLEERTQRGFDKLTEEYKLDLYTNAYLDAIVSKKIDTIISQKELDTLYKYSRENFKLNESLLKFRYISIANDNNDIENFSERLKRFDSIDKIVLDSLSIQFHSFMFNDSIWVKKSQLLQKLPILNKPSHLKLLKKSNFLHLKDSLRVYLVRVNDLLERNTQAPQQYVAPTLNQIILNKRKLKLIKQLKIELRNDAEQNNEFEIYN